MKRMTLHELKELVEDAIHQFGQDTEVYVDCYEQVAICTRPKEHYIDMDLKRIVKRVVT